MGMTERESPERERERERQRQNGTNTASTANKIIIIRKEKKTAQNNKAIVVRFGFTFGKCTWDDK